MKLRKISIVVLVVLLYVSCTVKLPENATDTGCLPTVFPNDFGAVIPCNIAPLNFRIESICEEIAVKVTGKNSCLDKCFKGQKTNFDVDEWSRFLHGNRNDSVFFTFYTKQNGKWNRFQPFSYFVAPDSIDEYLVYRLIRPGYQTWNSMGIYQRRLTDFTETKIVDNRLMPHSCVNCHSFAAYNPDNMLLHIRENHAGTILFRDGKLSKLKTKTPTTFSSVSFPYWHPSAKYIAFSINKVRQLFPAAGTERAHGFDAMSDMVIYDVDKNEFFTSEKLFSDDAYEAFPCFSPDGKRLYYVTAPALPMPQEIRNIRYSLCAIDFDALTGTLGSNVDTLISAYKLGKSVTMPRVSPDGTQIVVTLSDYGNFPAYDTCADLYTYNLVDSTFVSIEAFNSPQVESYHSWSSNGRWMVFASRRMDGLYMNCYIGYVDKSGRAHKPFLLPQKDADFHKSFLYSFNLPEFAVKKVEIDSYELEKVAKQSKDVQVKFEYSH
jgi:Tol biopolymer transport system component